MSNYFLCNIENKNINQGRIKRLKKKDDFLLLLLTAVLFTKVSFVTSFQVSIPKTDQTSNPLFNPVEKHNFLSIEGKSDTSNFICASA